MPFFSVITPTYNRAELIGKTIDSVLKQEFEDFELIVIDDGSTDNTKSIVEAYSDPRIIYYYQQNGERGKARNTGVRKAKGDYVFFLDSDDLIYPNHLKNAFAQLTELELPAFFHSRYELVFGTDKKQVKTLNKTTLKQTIRKQNQFACQFFLKRVVALDFPFSENRNLKIGEDWEVILKIAERFPLHFSNTVTAAIVQHGKRSMEISTAATILKSRDILLANLQKDTKIPTVVLGNVFAELTTLAGLSAVIDNHKKQALALWWKGILKRPSHIFKRRTLAIFKKIIFNGKT